jgi:hypothetical protein
MRYIKLMKKLYCNLINQIKKDFKKLEKTYPKSIGLIYILIGIAVFIIPIILLYLSIRYLLDILT